MKTSGSISLKSLNFASQWGEQYQRSFIINRGALKVSEGEHEVRVAVVEESPAELYRFLESFHMPKTVQFMKVGKADFASFIGTTTEYSGNEAAEHDDRIALDTVEQDAPVINIINALCIDAIKLGASDIHIEAQPGAVHIRYRIDGILRLVKKIEASLFRQVSNRLKVMASLNTLEQRLPQDGRMTVTIDGAALDLRVSIVPVSDGESIVLRLFRGPGKHYALEELGFTKAQLKLLKHAVRLPHGLVIMTGPTGSGKTTTLHALLQTLPSAEQKIITIEDPVEQYIPGINQIQINEAIKLGFDSMLRRVLRQDPDVIMVGEIRDSATAEIALRAALTGHVILSTVHTNDSVAVIPRLQDMGLESYLIAATLRCAAAQRLVRKRCSLCGGKGCVACGGTGYLGRTVIGETFLVDDEIEGMIASGAQAEPIRKALIKKGMKSLRDDGLEKVKQGITTREELEKEGLL
jgi:general secretion pathway protein E/type IV pilus assembly protein PilB